MSIESTEFGTLEGLSAERARAGGVLVPKDDYDGFVGLFAGLIKGADQALADLPGAKMTVEEFENARANLKKAEPDEESQASSPECGEDFHETAD